MEQNLFTRYAVKKGKKHTYAFMYFIYYVLFILLIQLLIYEKPMTSSLKSWHKDKCTFLFCIALQLCSIVIATVFDPDRSFFSSYRQTLKLGSDSSNRPFHSTASSKSTLIRACVYNRRRS